MLLMLMGMMTWGTVPENVPVPMATGRRNASEDTRARHQQPHGRQQQPVHALNRPHSRRRPPGTPCAGAWRYLVGGTVVLVCDPTGNPRCCEKGVLRGPSATSCRSPGLPRRRHRRGNMCHSPCRSRCCTMSIFSLHFAEASGAAAQ